MNTPGNFKRLILGEPVGTKVMEEAVNPKR
jgi:hypothetical protein